MTLPDKCPFCAAAVAIMSDGKPCRSAEGLWVAFECLTSLHAGHDQRTSQSRPCEAAERTRLSAEVDALRTANAALVERVKRLEEALSCIRDYWNKDNNERAMEDACWHAVNTASEALEAKP